MFFIHQPAVRVILAFGFALVIIMDMIFTILLTMIFLRPILKTMSEADATVAQQSAGYRHMQQTKWMTLTGATLAVVSSSILYLNIIFLFASGDQFSGSIYWTNPWLNPFVFGIAADSVFNDIGMTCVSGMVREVAGTRACAYTAGNNQVTPLNAAGGEVINSRAYDEESKAEERAADPAL